MGFTGLLQKSFDEGSAESSGDQMPVKAGWIRLNRGGKPPAKRTDCLLSNAQTHKAIDEFKRSSRLCWGGLRGKRIC